MEGWVQLIDKICEKILHIVRQWDQFTLRGRPVLLEGDCGCGAQ